jgi:hypothetical protein
MNTLVSGLQGGVNERLHTGTYLRGQTHLLDMAWYRFGEWDGGFTQAAGTPSTLAFIPPRPPRLGEVANRNVDLSLQDTGVLGGGVNEVGTEANVNESAPEDMDVDGREMGRAVGEERNQSGAPQQLPQGFNSDPYQGTEKLRTTGAAEEDNNQSGALQE